MTTIDNALDIFKEICEIPHGSYNTKAISDYCVNFAKKNNLRFIQDSSNNVVIFKDAAKGYEDHPAVIIQGHLDMVCEKGAGSTHDFMKDPLKLKEDDGYLSADNTTLGGDDGIAVAYALAILADDSLMHPALEVVLTVDEEVGMLGAAALDMSVLKGKYMLNIDSEEEGIFLTSCAGGMTAHIEVPVSYVEIKDDVTECIINISGLLGGHSGTEIIRGRANAHKILARLLLQLNQTVHYGIESVTGGSKDNAIPNNVELKILIDNNDIEAMKEDIKTLNEQLLSEYKNCDDDISITVSETDVKSGKVFDMKSREIVTFLLLNSPNGVVKMSSDIDNLVETSLNCGVLNTTDDTVNVGFSIRSSKESAKWALYEQLEYMAEFLGCECEMSGNYPGWAYKNESQLRNIISEVYTEQYGSKPEFSAIHAGLECGIFAGKLDDIDIVSFGPNIHDIHTCNEKMEIESAKRVFDFTLEVLKRL